MYATALGKAWRYTDRVRDPVIDSEVYTVAYWPRWLADSPALLRMLNGVVLSINWFSHSLVVWRSASNLSAISSHPRCG